MNSKQVIGVTGSTLVILGAFLPIASVPFLGGISYAFPPGGGLGDGLIVAAFGMLGLLGALRGGSFLLLLSSVFAALILGYSVSNFLGLMDSAQAQGGLGGAMMSAVRLDYGVGVIAVGLLLMLVASAMKASSKSDDPSDSRICPSCAETIKTNARKCRFCGEEQLIAAGDAQV